MPRALWCVCGPTCILGWPFEPVDLNSRWGFVLSSPTWERPGTPCPYWGTTMHALLSKRYAHASMQA